MFVCALPLLWEGMIIRLWVVETGLYEVGKLFQRGLAYRGRNVRLELQKHHFLSFLIDKKHKFHSFSRLKGITPAEEIALLTKAFYSV